MHFHEGEKEHAFNTGVVPSAGSEETHIPEQVLVEPDRLFQGMEIRVDSYRVRRS
jgi:hypothetical protein